MVNRYLSTIKSQVQICRLFLGSDFKRMAERVCFKAFSAIWRELARGGPCRSVMKRSIRRKKSAGIFSGLTTPSIRGRGHLRGRGGGGSGRGTETRVRHGRPGCTRAASAMQGDPGGVAQVAHGVGRSVLRALEGLARCRRRPERVGLTARDLCPDDKRGVYAVPTDKGHGHLESARPDNERARDEALARDGCEDLLRGEGRRSGAAAAIGRAAAAVSGRAPGALPCGSGGNRRRSAPACCWTA